MPQSVSLGSSTSKRTLFSLITKGRLRSLSHSLSLDTVTECNVNVDFNGACALGLLTLENNHLSLIILFRTLFGKWDVQSLWFSFIIPKSRSSHLLVEPLVLEAIYYCIMMNMSL